MCATETEGEYVGSYAVNLVGDTLKMSPLDADVDDLKKFYNETGVVTWPQLGTIGLWIALSAFTMLGLGSLANYLTAR